MVILHKIVCIASCMFFLILGLAAANYAGVGDAYRTAFHFQPPRNWMNDPNGPMFHKGYYHLFYQYNPFGPVWSYNISWGHAVSEDLVHWFVLDDPALVPDQWYDRCGCWSGSATFVSQEKPIILYTGLTFSHGNQYQVQAMAIPADYTDPLLRKWIKVSDNPLLLPPHGINDDNFRDPTTAWMGSDGKWRMLIGAKKGDEGFALLYKSSDLIKWEQLVTPLLSIPNTGMWECPDFFPVLSNASQTGLDVSIAGPDVKHVVKFGLFETSHDYYAVGTYSDVDDSFTPLNANPDEGIGLRLDYGKFYASKSFYDSNKGRRILIGWVNESSSREADIAKGWASLQGIPRVLWLDNEREDRLVQWPIDEIENLRKTKHSLEDFNLEKGSLVEVKGNKMDQLDIEVTFSTPDLSDAESCNVDASNVQMLCSEKGIHRTGIIGPFGLLVLASDDQVEHTAVFFYIVSSKGRLKAVVCNDQSRSSLATDLDRSTYGGLLPLSQKDKLLSLRILVDHSIIETFAQGGKLCVTSRVYPTKAVGDKTHLFVFNNGSVPIQVKQLKAWEMEAVHIRTIAAIIDDYVEEETGLEVHGSKLYESAPDPGNIDPFCPLLNLS